MFGNGIAITLWATHAKNAPALSYNCVYELHATSQSSNPFEFGGFSNNSF
jgi:hypothetical protein